MDRGYGCSFIVELYCTCTIKKDRLKKWSCGITSAEALPQLPLNGGWTSLQMMKLADLKAGVGGRQQPLLKSPSAKPENQRTPVE
jgi:hypothetical protein